MEVTGVTLGHVYLGRWDVTRGHCHPGEKPGKAVPTSCNAEPGARPHPSSFHPRCPASPGQCDHSTCQSPCHPCPCQETWGRPHQCQGAAVPCRAMPCHAMPGSCWGPAAGQEGVSLKRKHFVPIGGLSTHWHARGKSTWKTKTSHCGHGAGGWVGGDQQNPLCLWHTCHGSQHSHFSPKRHLGEKFPAQLKKKEEI